MTKFEKIMNKLLFLFVSLVALFIASCGSKDITITTYEITVDYAESIEEIIQEGNYGFVDRRITSSVFVENEVTYTDTVIRHQATLLYFDEGVKSEDVLAKMKEQGYRSATAKELYVLGAQHPSLQRESQIVALGSITSNSLVPILSGYSNGRRVELTEWSQDWYRGFGEVAFLAFK